MSQTFYWQSKKTTSRKAVPRQQILAGVDELVRSVFPLGFVPEDNRQEWWTVINTTDYNELRAEIGLGGEEDLSLMLPPMNDFESDVLKKLRGDMSRLNEDGCCYPYSSKNMTSIKSLLKAWVSVAQEITVLDTEKTKWVGEMETKNVQKESANETTKEGLIREINVLVKNISDQNEQLKNKKNTKNRIVSSLKNIFTAEPSWIVDKRKKGKLVTPFHKTLQKSIERSTAHLQRAVTDIHPSVKNSKLIIPRSIATNYPLGIVAQPQGNVAPARAAVNDAEQDWHTATTLLKNADTELTTVQTAYKDVLDNIRTNEQDKNNLKTHGDSLFVIIGKLLQEIDDTPVSIQEGKDEIKKINEELKELEKKRLTLGASLSPKEKDKLTTTTSKQITILTKQITTIEGEITTYETNLIALIKNKDNLDYQISQNDTSLRTLEGSIRKATTNEITLRGKLETALDDKLYAQNNIRKITEILDKAKIALNILDTVVIDANWDVFDMFNHRDDIQSVKMLKNVHGVKLKASVIIGFSATGQIKQHASCPWYHDGFAGTVWEYKIPTHSRMMLKDCEWRAALDVNDVPLMDLNLPRGLNEYAIRLSFLGSDGKISPLSNIITGRDVHHNMKKVVARKKWGARCSDSDVERISAKVNEVLTLRQPPQRLGFLKRVMWLEQSGRLRDNAGRLRDAACMYLEPTLVKISLETEADTLLRSGHLRVSNMPSVTSSIPDVTGYIPPVAAPVVAPGGGGPPGGQGQGVGGAPGGGKATQVVVAPGGPVQGVVVAPAQSTKSSDSDSGSDSDSVNMDETGNMSLGGRNNLVYVKPVAAKVELVAAKVETVAANVKPVAAKVELIAAKVELIAAKVETVVAKVETVAENYMDSSDTDSVGGADWKTTWAMDETVSELSDADKPDSSSGHGMWASTSSGTESSVVKSEVWASSTSSGTDQLPAAWASSTSSGTEIVNTPSDTDELVSSDGDSSKNCLEDALWAASASGTESDKASLSGTEESSSGIWASTTGSSAEDEDNLNNITALVNTVPVYAPWASAAEANMWASDDDDE